MSIKGENNGKAHFSQEVFRKRIFKHLVSLSFAETKID